MHGWYYDHLMLMLFSDLKSLLFRSILHDRKVFNNPQEFQPERYLKDGKLNPDTRDPDCAAFGFGRRSVNMLFSNILVDSPNLPQYMSWKTFSRQLVIFNYILCPGGI